MNPKLKIQKNFMQLAINWMNSIEACDNYIERGVEVAYYIKCKEKAIDGYVAAMQEVAESIHEMSQERIKSDFITA
jgi:hypothetical protein